MDRSEDARFVDMALSVAWLLGDAGGFDDAALELLPLLEINTVLILCGSWLPPLVINRNVVGDRRLNTILLLLLLLFTLDVVVVVVVVVVVLVGGTFTRVYIPCGLLTYSRLESLDRLVVFDEFE